jgi:kynurenine formamidase
MKFIDLSSTIATSPEGTLPFLRTEVAYSNHAAGAAQAQAILKVPPSVFKDSEGWATETLHLGTHDSTHIDALALQQRHQGRLPPSTKCRWNGSSAMAWC